MRKQDYLRLLMQQGPEWVRSSMTNPTVYMNKTHFILHGIALRRMRPEVKHGNL